MMRVKRCVVCVGANYQAHLMSVDNVDGSKKYQTYFTPEKEMCSDPTGPGKGLNAMDLWWQWANTGRDWGGGWRWWMAGSHMAEGVQVHEVFTWVWSCSLRQASQTHHRSTGVWTHLGKHRNPQQRRTAKGLSDAGEFEVFCEFSLKALVWHARIC